MAFLSASSRIGANFHNRNHSLTLGQFLEQNPLGFDSGDSNLYRYVRNEPTNATDPSGEGIVIKNRPIDLDKLLERYAYRPFAQEYIRGLIKDKMTHSFETPEELYWEIDKEEAKLKRARPVSAFVGGFDRAKLPPPKIEERYLPTELGSAGDEITLVAVLSTGSPPPPILEGVPIASELVVGLGTFSVPRVPVPGFVLDIIESVPKVLLSIICDRAINLPHGIRIKLSSGATKN